MKEERSLKVGDILVSCWGYDACLYNFYEVVGLTKTMARLRELKTKIAGQTDYAVYNGSLIAPVTEGAERFAGGAFTRKPHRYGCDISVAISSYEFAHIWDGKPRDEYNAH